MHDALLEGMNLAGVVLRAGDDEPIQGIEVQAIAHDLRMRKPVIAGMTSTRDQGSLRFARPVVAMRPHRLVFLRDDMGTVGGRTEPEGGTDSIELMRPAVKADAAYVLDLADAGRPLDQLVVRLEPGWVAHGRVADSAGRPLKGACVAGRAGLVMTDGEGRFSISGPRSMGRVEIVSTRDPMIGSDLGSFPLVPRFLSSLCALRGFDLGEDSLVVDLGTVTAPDPHDW